MWSIRLPLTAFIVVMLTVQPARAQSLAELAQKAQQAKEGREKAEAERAKTSADAKATKEKTNVAKPSEANPSESPSKEQPKRSFTNKDLDHLSIPGSTTASESASARSGTAGTQLPKVEVTTADTEAARSAAYRTAAKKDEAYWKARMQDLHNRLSADQTFLKAAVARAHELDVRLHKSPDNADYIVDRLVRAEVQYQWDDAVKELSRLNALVTNDTRAISVAEDEAREANVLPGWLRGPGI
jgi:hypothetical protein